MMKVSRCITFFSAVFLIFIQLFLFNSSAHPGEKFYVNLYENELVPDEPTIRVNDTVRFWNFDKTENATHRILIDINSDGIYNGNDDWDSGNLTYCERNDDTNSSKSCNDRYEFTFNESVMNRSYNGIIGVYKFVDILSNGEKFYGNITVNADYHLTAGFQDDNYVKDKEIEDDDLGSNFLLVIAAASALGTIILGGMILFGKEEE